MKTIQTQGILSAFGAYLLWGLLPIYWKLLKQASALEIFSHRVLWSLLFLLIIVGITRRTTLFRQETLNVLDQPRKILGILITAALISFNWLVYIWAVNDNRIVETSLGYYINPLVNVLIGVLLLKEKLSHRQYFAVLLAVARVLNLVLHFGKVPWVALSLAVSFALYGLCKKLLGPGRNDRNHSGNNFTGTFDLSLSDMDSLFRRQCVWLCHAVRNFTFDWRGYRNGAADGIVRQRRQ